MTLLSDAAVSTRLLTHIANRTTDAGETPWREPTLHYQDPDRFHREIELLRSRPSVFCPSAALPGIGSYTTRDHAGVPLLVARGTDGRVRAFRNACRHRGMQLVSGNGCRRAFVCAYHGWTYGLAGELRRVPHEAGFPGIDRLARGLAEVGAEERHGLVFVRLDGSARSEVDLEEVAGVITQAHDLRACTDTEEPVNWKILVETFLEGLHIRFLHRSTFFPLQYDNVNLVERFGPHSRVTFPYRAVERLADVSPDERTLDGRVTFVYHLFPNVIVATFPGQILVIAVEPIDVAHSRLSTYALEPHPGGDESSERTTTGGFDLLLDGGREDFEAARRVQLGLSTGANEHLEFGLYESAIAHFHRTLTAALHARETPLRAPRRTPSSTGSHQDLPPTHLQSTHPRGPTETA
jgi:phenylpropionate dioxygenase-like ring-hydroxylating dioxygenase large terminal subunit